MGLAPERGAGSTQLTSSSTPDRGTLEGRNERPCSRAREARPCPKSSDPRMRQPSAAAQIQEARFSPLNEASRALACPPQRRELTARTRVRCPVAPLPSAAGSACQRDPVRRSQSALRSWLAPSSASPTTTCAPGASPSATALPRRRALQQESRTGWLSVCQGPVERFVTQSRFRESVCSLRR